MAPRPSPRTRLVAAGALVTALGFSIALRLWVFPAVDEPGRADAVVVLGGGGARERHGIDLVVEGTADTLVFFTPFVEEVGFYAVRSCNSP